MFVTPTSNVKVYKTLASWTERGTAAPGEVLNLLSKPQTVAGDGWISTVVQTDVGYIGVESLRPVAMPDLRNDLRIPVHALPDPGKKQVVFFFERPSTKVNLQSYVNELSLEPRKSSVHDVWPGRSKYDGRKRFSQTCDQRYVQSQLSTTLRV